MTGCVFAARSSYILARRKEAEISTDTSTATVFRFEREQLNALAESKRESYAAGDPYPHIVIDDFLPEHVLDTGHNTLFKARPGEELPEPLTPPKPPLAARVKNGIRLLTPPIVVELVKRRRERRGA